MIFSSVFCENSKKMSRNFRACMETPNCSRYPQVAPHILTKLLIFLSLKRLRTRGGGRGDQSAECSSNNSLSFLFHSAFFSSCYVIYPHSFSTFPPGVCPLSPLLPLHPFFSYFDSSSSSPIFSYFVTSSSSPLFLVFC